jgi:copper chaperone CopZ
MITETLNIANMKCSGCAHSITTKLAELPGVISSEVNIDEGTIKMVYDPEPVREHILKKLSSMGYPEATADNGLLMQVKSYANCMIGKATK